jgi:hypothetical protein
MSDQSVNSLELRPASPIDYAEFLVQKLPASRAPYILAQLALTDRLEHTALEIGPEQVLRTLLDAEAQGQLRPPLCYQLVLKQEIEVMIQQLDERRKTQPTAPLSNAPAAVLLAWVVDYGFREHSHSPGLIN